MQKLWSRYLFILHWWGLSTMPTGKGFNPWVQQRVLSLGAGATTKRRSNRMCTKQHYCSYIQAFLSFYLSTYSYSYRSPYHTSHRSLYHLSYLSSYQSSHHPSYLSSYLRWNSWLHFWSNCSSESPLCSRAIWQHGYWKMRELWPWNLLCIPRNEVSSMSTWNGFSPSVQCRVRSMSQGGES